ncbi:hypothetical protein H4R99_008293 [Coemansia sp. RSA 1722]|nr:hypothetical protein LPJ57_002686 [Coemansia sp. RSA 486]KAJ2225201.1 hypothetical protein IWW45_007941 [Coemansia sp. RSA 485]KAJ2586988.1 hypothetical protein H4R99_008293 [Coemansia sp. RSA 1722]KAJ2638165.1 hypothetical protein GGF40_001856 [Coemansia sp. RSA 1286]
MRFSSFTTKSIAAACALAHVASAGLSIPTTSIENTSEYFEGVSKNWENVEKGLNDALSSFKENNVGAYRVMTSIYGSEIPDKFDSDYLSSLLSKLGEVGTKSWDDKELNELASEYSDSESESDSDTDSSNGASSLGKAVGTASLAIAAVAALALGAL